MLRDAAHGFGDLGGLGGSGFGVVGDRFALPANASAFQKSQAGKQFRCLAGVTSTESADGQGDTSLADGLNWAPFKDHGVFNDDHSSKTLEIYAKADPDSVLRIHRGDVLPDGEMAPNEGWWAGGYLLEGYPRAEELWSLIKSLREVPGAPTRIGFSVQGFIKSRIGPNQKTIARADVHHVAVTRIPWNGDTHASLMMKSRAIVLDAITTRSGLDAEGEPGADVPWLAAGAGPAPALSPEVLAKSAAAPIYTDAGRVLTLSPSARKAGVLYAALALDPSLSWDQGLQLADLAAITRSRKGATS